MKVVRCTRCGSSELLEAEGFATCSYCKSRFVLEESDRPPVESAIGVADDVKALLEKCRSDPANRWRYASLILDIDPTNAEVEEYLS